MKQHFIRYLTGHLTGQASNPPSHLMANGQRLAMRLRVPILALLGAVLLQGALLLMLAETKPFAVGARLFGSDATGKVLAAPLADDDHDDHILRYGVIVSRPVETLGSWVISDSKSTTTTLVVTYTVTESTQVEEELVIGRCVEVESTEGEPTVATKIVGKEASNCHSDDDDDDDEPVEYSLYYGLVITRPDGSHVGTWVISDTVYTATESTLVYGELVVGKCAEVKVAQSAPTLAVKIIEKDLWKCNAGGDDDDDDDDDSGGYQNEYILRYGLLNSRPAEKIGTWVISGTAYSVNNHTYIAGFMSVGNCVEVKVEAGEPTVALKLVKKELSKCNAAGDDDDDDYRREWEGSIVSFPPQLVGSWTIAIGENKRLTFTTDLETDFDPALATDYAVGYWVEVKVKRQQDGSLLAERVRVDDHEVGQIVVRLESAAYSATLASEYGLILHSTLLNRANIYLFTTVDENEQRLVGQIAQEDGVIWAEVNYVNSVPEDDGYKTWGWGGHDEPDAYFNQFAYEQVGIGYATRAYQGEGVVVAVLDTGIYTPHEQFLGKVQLPSLDVISDDSDPSEVGPGLAWGHGTHVAGVIAAMAPEAKILPVRVLDANGRGNTFLLAYAIEWAAAQPGVKVINLSLGTEFDSKILRDVIENVVEQGIIVVAAAGNSGTSQVQYPAGYEGVIAVTAVDGNSHKASFANYGSTWVDLAAPGVGIMSTMITADGPGYATWSGTSMSTAFVSGAAVLVAEKWEVSTTQDGGMLGQLINTGLGLDALNPLYAGQIGRLLDVSAALEVQASLLFLPQTEK